MDPGRLIRQNDDLSDVVLSEESIVAPVPGGLLDVNSFFSYCLSLLVRHQQ